MANHISHASLPFPVKGARYTVLIPFLDSSGTPTDPTSLDTEVSQDNGAFADAAEEVTLATGSHGMGMITLTGAETNNSSVGVFFGCATAKPTLGIYNPRVLPTLLSGTASAGANGSITLAAGAFDLLGCIVKTTGGTGGGGTGGANNQARVITTYNTSTLVATVSPNWETNPDATTTYDILLTDMACNAPVTRGLRPATDGRALVVDASGLADANTVKVGPTGSGAAQTAKDIGALNVTNVNTLAGHDPGATLGTSTLTQAQVSGGAYALNSSSFSFNAALDFTTAQKAATIARVTLVDTSTALTNAPTAGDLTATMKTSVGTAVAASAVASVTAGVTLAAGAIVTATFGVCDFTATQKTSLQAAAAAAIAAAVPISANITKVNGITIGGAGTTLNPWGPA